MSETVCIRCGQALPEPLSKVARERDELRLAREAHNKERADLREEIRRLTTALSAEQAQRDELRREVERWKNLWDREIKLNWTASLCDRLNELVRENRKHFEECHDGPSASELIKQIHGWFNTYRHKSDGDAATLRRYREAMGATPDSFVEELGIDSFAEHPAKVVASVLTAIRTRAEPQEGKSDGGN